MKEIILHHKAQKLKTFKEESAYVGFILDLASYIPVEYIEGGPVVGHDNKIINDIVKHHKKLNFQVDLDGIYLKKPTYFTPEENQPYACISFDKKIKVTENNDGNKTELIKFKGYFFSYDKLLTPRELNGVAIRIKGIPIAVEYGYDTTLMAYPNYVDQIFRNWISGEIYIEEGLEDAMNIDRKSFRVTHPHYIALQNFLHQFLRENFFSKDVKNIYETNRKRRATAKENVDKEKKRKILDSKKVIVTVEIKESKKEETTNDIKPVSIKKKGETSTVTIDQSFKKQFRKSDWVELEDIFIIFERAYNESNGDVNTLKRLFYNFIAEYKRK